MPFGGGPRACIGQYFSLLEATLATASIVHAFNPELVVLGGGVTRAGDLLFEPVRRVVHERAMSWLAEPVRIVPAELGDMTGVLGAVAVALERIGDSREKEAMASG